MKNLIKKINLTKKIILALMILLVFILVIGASVYAWSNKKLESAEVTPTVLGDDLKTELTESQIIVQGLLAKKFNYETKDINVVVTDKSAELIVGIASIDSPSHAQAINFVVKKINNVWRVVEADDNGY